jgi:hypothetical protein
LTDFDVTTQMKFSFRTLFEIEAWTLKRRLKSREKIVHLLFTAEGKRGEKMK